MGRSYSLKQWAILPIKPFAEAKTRLSGTLSPAERAALAEEFYRHSLSVLMQVRALEGVLVTSRDPLILDTARRAGAYALLEAGAPELNAAIRGAIEVACVLDADGVLILPADLPLITPEDIAQILDLGCAPRVAVLTPDAHYEGTNGLYLSPPDLFTVHYGPGSFARHKALAEATGAAVHIYESPHMALDIDTPADLNIYHSHPLEPTEHHA